jgi:putative PIN family toxin of toxin-antitoxin system
MKLVLDANVFISAFYWGGNPQKIIEGIIEGKDRLYTSNEILGEIAAVMARPKFKSGPETIKKYIQTIEKIGKKVFIPGNIKGICRDKDDDDKIECGILSGADYIITGDDDLLTLKQYKRLKIVTIKEYLQITNGFDTSAKTL